MGKTVTWLIMHILLIFSATAHADFLFTAEGCEYSVKFPSTPEYKTSFDPHLGEYIQAEYTAGDDEPVYFLRSECIGTGDIRNAEINSKESLQKQIVAYAESNGLRNTEYHYGEGNLGKFVHARGFKTISGVSLTYEAYIYVGNNSFITLYAGGVSSNYPQAPVSRFLRSVEKRNKKAN